MEFFGEVLYNILMELKKSGRNNYGSADIFFTFFNALRFINSNQWPVPASFISGAEHLPVIH